MTSTPLHEHKALFRALQDAVGAPDLQVCPGEVLFGFVLRSPSLGFSMTVLEDEIEGLSLRQVYRLVVEEWELEQALRKGA